MNGDEIEEVDDFTYLDSKMSNTEDGEVEIRARLAKASQAFASLRSTWKARNIRLKTKSSNQMWSALSYMDQSHGRWPKLSVTNLMSSKTDASDGFYRSIGQIPSPMKNYTEEQTSNHLHPSQTKALVMDRTHAPPADYSLNQNCPTMDSRRPKKERPPQGNLEENSREGDEGKGLDMGPSGACLSWSTPLAGSGWGLMCYLKHKED